jgi:hypothetical protein
VRPQKRTAEKVLAAASAAAAAQRKFRAHSGHKTRPTAETLSRSVDQKPDLDRFRGGLDRVRKDDPIFFAFDSDVVSVAFNLSQLAHAHALFDPVSPPSEEPDAIQVLLAGERDWLTFDANPDEPDGAEPGAFQGQLTELLTDLESAPFREPFVSLDDVDGERAVFHVDAMSVIEIPQRLLWDYED